MDKMTIFYKKTNGKIVNISSGVQDFTIFEDEIQAMTEYNSLVMDEDAEVMNHPGSYMISNRNIIIK